jgi:hypothetical protein
MMDHQLQKIILLVPTSKRSPAVAYATAVIDAALSSPRQIALHFQQ